MNDTLQFAQPAWIGIGIATCLALAFGLARWNRRRDRDLRKLAHSRLLAQLTDSVSRKRRVLKQALWLVALFLLFVAVARPQYGFEYREVKRRGIDLVFAVDTSRSMLAEDVVPNRLERAKLAITDFVEKLEGDRVGLIPFAGNAFSLCPLTLDYGAFFQSLDALDTGIIPHQGTDLATAVREANRLFDAEGNNHRILILITDGEDLQGAVMDAVAAAREKGMTIFTVGVGDPAGALIPLTQADGSQDFVRDEKGEPVRTALDESTLRKVAEATGGLYAPLGATGQGLETIYQEKLRLVPKSELNQRLDRIPLERFEWPLAAAIGLLLLEFLLGDRRRVRSRATPVISAARRRAATAGTALLAAFLAMIGTVDAQDAPASPSENAETSPSPDDFTDPRVAYNAGTSAYREGDFARAEEALGHSLGSTDDLSLQQRGYYNLGNTRYRLGQQTREQDPQATIAKWEEAVKSYEDALALNPEDEDAQFNRDLVKRKLEELKRQQEQENPQQDQSRQDQEQNQNQSAQEPSSQEQQQQDSSSSSEAGEQEQNEQQSEDGSSSSEPDKEKPSSEDQQQAGQGSQSDSESQASGEEQQEGGEKGDEAKPEEPSGDESAGKEAEQPDSNPSEEAEASEKAAEQKGDAEPESRPDAGEQGEESEPQSSQPSPGELGPEDAPEEPEQTAAASRSSSKKPDRKPEGTPTFSEERREPGEMSREEAAQLLEALENDERSVLPLPDARTYRRSVPDNTTRGKTW